MKLHPSRRAQSSVEYLLIVGVAFMIIMPMLYIFSTYTISTRDEVSLTKLDRIGRMIVSAAEEMYYLGPPSRTTLRYTMPDNVYAIEVAGENDDILVFTYGAPKGDALARSVIITSRVPLDASGIAGEEFRSAGRKVLVVEASRAQLPAPHDVVVLHGKS